MDRLTNDQLIAALESMLHRCTTYSAQDLCAFALGVEWAQDNLVAAERERCATVRDALSELDARLRGCMNDPISAAEAYDSFYQEIVANAMHNAVRATK